MSTRMRRAYYYSLFGALFVGLLVRIPGVFWGFNFPTGWKGHHIDEYAHVQNAKYLIDPSEPIWMHPYPKGMAAHVAVPMLGIRALTGRLFERPENDISLIVPGRVISVLYGTATIFIVFLLTRRLFRDPRVAHYAAWILALGGLHVSQSHFFLSDAPSIFWFLLGSYLLLLELETPDKSNSFCLMMAAFCAGVSFGLKLAVHGLPTLAVVAIMYRPRVIRSIQAIAFFIAGLVLVNFASFTPYDLFTMFYRGISNPYQVSWWSKLLMYLIELPSVVSLPVVLFLLGGSYFLARRFLAERTSARSRSIALVVIVPLFISAVLTVYELSQFPRHIVPFIPWIAMVTAWSLVRTGDWLGSKGLSPALVIVPFFAYLALFVYDGERVFLNEPRNEAARWIQQNFAPGTPIYWKTPYWLEGYEYTNFPDEGRPPVLAIQMDNANHYLSGMGLRDSYPEDYRTIFNGVSQDRVEGLQAVFRGTTEYREVARFREGYFMPEYVVVDRLIGNRSRNYVAEIVIFVKGTEINRDTGNEP